jgi:hypothetical protein
MKFIPNPAHLFECTVPPPPEEILEYRHPIWPLITYSNGVVDALDGFSINFASSNQTLCVTWGSRPGWEPGKILEYWPGTSVSRAPSESIKTKNKRVIVYECYHGVLLDAHSRIGLWDFNPYNLSIENMFLIGDFMQDAKAYAKWCKKRSEFEKRTLLEIERIALEALKKGWDPEQYIKKLGLPTKILNKAKKSQLIEV